MMIATFKFLTKPMMRKNLLLLAGCLLLLPLFTAAQSPQDPILFTVGNATVPLSEFKYVYTKTNQDKADFSEASIRDYLDLYVRFKLKVQNARELHLDTVSATKSELESYRRQLANSYLEDKEVTDKLVRETYDRMQQDVEISQIFVACDRNAKPADTLRAFGRALRLLQMVQRGADFAQIAVDSSDDKTAKENRGNIGFITAMMPDGYYLLEKAAYSTKPGTIYGMPIRSNVGYHIIKVHSTRPARAEIEVGHILFRKGENNPAKATQAKMRADSVYQALKNGANWDELCKLSEDKNTKDKSGYLGFFGINRYQRAFEDAAFGIEKDGGFAAPVETSIGYHIIKRVSRRGLMDYDKLKRPLTDRVRRDSRSEIARQSMIARIKREGNYSEDRKALDAWAAKLDSSFVTFKWKPDPAKPAATLARFGDATTYTIADFEEYCSRASRERMRGAGTPNSEVIEKLFKSWTDEIALRFEESQLDKKYPEFKNLMREYNEGIIMFEALKINVFDRANTDSTGLEEYFKTVLLDKYKWDERAKVSLYTLKTDDPKVLEQLRKLAAKKPAADVLKKMNKKAEVVSVMDRLLEKGKAKELGNLWAAGAMTDAKVDAGTKTATFYKIESIMPPTNKTLNEARGYAVADYQDFLERRWIEDLRKKYPVKIDETVLKSIVKK